MNIRKMAVSDLDKIMEIENSIFIDPWTKKAYEDDLTTNKYSYLYVLEENNEIIGYSGVWIVSDYATITTIGIKKEYQGKGYSKFLMQNIISLCEQNDCVCIDLEVRVSNLKAINLYNSFNFEIKTIRKQYYGNEDAYLMVKQLKGGQGYERVHISN